MRPPDCIDQVDGVVFDFGGVISVSPMDGWKLFPYCETQGLSRAAVMEGWYRYRMLWDGGAITFSQMWERIFADNGMVLTDAVLEELWNVDACSWIAQLREDTLQLMKRLRSCGKKIGLLTNMAGEFYEKLYLERAQAYRELTDVEVVSGLVGMAKPLRGIYDYTQRQMGIPASRLLFFDDTPANVEAALKYGWQSMLYPPPGKQF